MSLRIFLAAAALLSLERICYIWVWHFPESFRGFCARPLVASFGEPVAVLRRLFYCFKAVQIAVFAGWCYYNGYGAFSPLAGGTLAQVAGGALIVGGQILNFSVFYRLGSVGVFYGNRYGYEIPWCSGFPFSLLKHPQYVGTVFSVWGLFLAIGFRSHNWFILPSLETIYYVLGACFEQQ